MTRDDVRKLPILGSRNGTTQYYKIIGISCPTPGALSVFATDEGKVMGRPILALAACEVYEVTKDDVEGPYPVLHCISGPAYDPLESGYIDGDCSNWLGIAINEESLKIFENDALEYKERNDRRRETINV